MRAFRAVHIRSLLACLAFMLSALLSGCEEDTAPKADEAAALVGEWRMDRVAINGQEDYASDYSGFRLRIAADGSALWLDPTGNTLGGPVELSGLWSYDEPSRILDLAGGALRATVVSLDERYLRLELQVDDFKLETATFALRLERL